MKTIINWIKWDDEKPDTNKEICVIRHNNEVSLAEYYLDSINNEWLYMEESSYKINELHSAPLYWCYTSELIPEENNES